VRCIGEAVRIMAEAAKSAGAPDDLILCMASPTLEGTHEAMKARETALILATGGPDLVRAAYSMGKPAYGVGPGNAPAFIERTADVEHAVRAIVGSQMFDNATICASEQSVVIDKPIEAEVRAEFTRNRAHWCTPEEREKLSALVVRGRRVNAAIVGLFPHQIAALAGFTIPEETTVLLTNETGVGWDHPLSVEKLSPILSVYVEDGWEAGCERCIEILNFGGRGHTLAIHSRDEEVIWAYVMEKPTHRILVNAPSAQGAVGYGTGLVPSMTLGCGAFGGNITSDNISAHNLVLTKHVGYCYEGFVEGFPDFTKGPPTELKFVHLPASPAPGVRASSGSGAVGSTGAVAPNSPAPSNPVYHGNPPHPSSPFFDAPSPPGKGMSGTGKGMAPPPSAAPAAHPAAETRAGDSGTRPPYEGGPIPTPKTMKYRN
jgi:acetaldehyde dehydrogenase (acetylating)